MATPTTFCTLADVVALVSYDAQARLATDPALAVPLAVKGDGVADTFDTPFMLATTIVTNVAGVVTANTLSPGTGTGGRDQVVFAAPPALGALITAQADLKAVNVDVVQQCIVLGANKIKGSLARYNLAGLDAAVIEVLQPLNVFFARWFLRCRRQMNEYDPIITEYKSQDAWLMGVATGKIALPSTAKIATAAPPNPSNIYTEAQVFEPPGFTEKDIFHD